MGGRGVIELVLGVGCMDVGWSLCCPVKRAWEDV